MFVRHNGKIRRGHCPKPSELAEFGAGYREAFGTLTIPFYTHIRLCHLADLMSRHPNIWDLSQQGVEHGHANRKRIQDRASRLKAPAFQVITYTYRQIMHILSDPNSKENTIVLESSKKHVHGPFPANWADLERPTAQGGEDTSGDQSDESYAEERAACRGKRV